MRDCPKCHHLAEAEIVGGVELDRCSSCRGILLDKGELGQLLRERVHGENRVASTASAVDAQKAHCHECSRAMDARLVSGVRVDVCPGCGLTFLDNGELAAIQANRKR